MRARVLIVDDDEVYLDGMKELLEEAGYDVFLASSFEDGRQKLRDHAPDLSGSARLTGFNSSLRVSFTFQRSSSPVSMIRSCAPTPADSAQVTSSNQSSQLRSSP